MDAPVAAMELIDLGGDIAAGWTNSVRLSSLYQFKTLPPTAAYYCSQSQPANCGYDAGFSQGRVDWQSELSLTHAADALHVSLDARKDAVEAKASYFELFEAYGQTGGTLLGRPLTLLVGRHSVIWGESLMFPTNAIAGAQAPIDSTSGRGSVGYQAASRFLPVAQASFTWQLDEGLALIGYQQAEWRRNRVDRHDAYADAGDLLGNEWNDSIAVVLPNSGHLLYRRAYGSTPDGLDQFGLGLRGRWGDADLGLYGLRYDAKTPNLAYDYSDRLYQLNYARAIELLGVSAAVPIGESSLAGEISGRRHMPLVTGGYYAYGKGFGAYGNNSGAYGNDFGPRGDTLQGQISFTRAIAPQPGLPGGASWSTELAGNHLISVTDGAGERAPGRSRGAAAIRSVLTAQFYQLWPRVDLSLPISVGYNFLGLSPVLPDMNRGTGDVGVGVVASLDQRWNLSLGFTHYFGASKIPLAPAGLPSYGGWLSRWDEGSLSLQHSF